MSSSLQSFKDVYKAYVDEPRAYHTTDHYLTLLEDAQEITDLVNQGRVCKHWRDVIDQIQRAYEQASVSFRPLSGTVPYAYACKPCAVYIMAYVKEHLKS